MSAITTMLEAVLGPTTELTHACELVRSAGHCGTDEPRWWAVDIGVRAQVVDTRAGAVSRPGPSAFASSQFGSHAPLHLCLEVGLTDRRSGSSREWLVDMTSMRAYVFASTITISARGPKSLVSYADVGKSPIAEQVVFGRVHAGIWPCDTEHLRVGVPGPSARGCSCTLRVLVPAGVADVAVLIPPGARTLTIFDTSGSSRAWAWQLGEASSGRRGRIVLVNGESATTAVPNFTHVAPADPFGRDREVLLVFGVDL